MQTKQYSGFGSKNDIHNSKIEMFRASDTNKNSADTMIIWQLSRIAKDYDHIYICTKDNGFRTVKILIEKDSETDVTFISGWEELRNEIE